MNAKGCAACEIEMRMNRAWARIDGRKEPTAHECTHQTPPPAIVEFCAPRPAYGTGPTERDAAYGSDPVEEVVTPTPMHLQPPGWESKRNRVPHACYDAHCDCAWVDLGDEWPEEEKTVADR